MISMDTVIARPRTGRVLARYVPVVVFVHKRGPANVVISVDELRALPLSDVLQRLKGE